MTEVCIKGPGLGLRGFGRFEDTDDLGSWTLGFSKTSLGPENHYPCTMESSGHSFSYLETNTKSTQGVWVVQDKPKTFRLSSLSTTLDLVEVGVLLVRIVSSHSMSLGFSM